MPILSTHIWCPAGSKDLFGDQHEVLDLLQAVLSFSKIKLGEEYLLVETIEAPLLI